MGKKIGDETDPLLVSVRSGAPFSMPGMMDTVLNLGLNDKSVQGLIKQTNNERFAWDSYRRFIQMFSSVVMGVEGQLFEDAINEKKAEKGVKLDTDLTAEDLKELTETFKRIFAKNVDSQAHPEVAPEGVASFPQDPYLQLRLAEQAVFGSWNTERAVLYRKQNKIDDSLGTAVNVQVMVFGNKGDSSATGVAFTRNPADGTNERYGDFLVNAQGEDVVAGIRNTEPIADLVKIPELKEAGEQLFHVFEILEDHYAFFFNKIDALIHEGKARVRYDAAEFNIRNMHFIERFFYAVEKPRFLYAAAPVMDEYLFAFLFRDERADLLFRLFSENDFRRRKICKIEHTTPYKLEIQSDGDISDIALYLLSLRFR